MHRLLAATCLALCCAAPAQATDWSGIWRYETCETGGDSWVIAAGLEAVLSEADFYTAPVKISHAPTAGNWHSLHSADGYRYYVAMTEAEELVFLDLTEEATDRYSDAVNSGSCHSRDPSRHLGGNPLSSLRCPPGLFAAAVW